MRLTCLMPSFHRPTLVRSALGMFLGQKIGINDEYRMLVLEDSGTLLPWEYSTPDGGKHIKVLSSAERYPSLPAKYNALVAHDNGWADTYVVWDDDDVYLPNHLESIVTSSADMLSGILPFYHPEQIFSMHTWVTRCDNGHVLRIFDYRGDATTCDLCGGSIEDIQLDIENAVGRFHGSLAVSALLLTKLEGWIKTSRADFDQQMLAACSEQGFQVMNDCFVHFPTYVYGWRRAHHCSLYMSSPDNENWYSKYGEVVKKREHAFAQYDPSAWLQDVDDQVIDLPLVDPIALKTLQVAIHQCSDEAMQSDLLRQLSKMSLGGPQTQR